jgi:hypothetical protein
MTPSTSPAVGGAIFTNDYDHHGAALPHKSDNAKHNIFFESNDKLTARDIIERNPSVGTLESLTNTGIDAQYANHSLVARHHNMPNLALMLWLSQKLVEAHVRRQQKSVSIHHVASLMASLHQTEKIVR